VEVGRVPAAHSSDSGADSQAPKKQRHTAWRIFERLREEHGFVGGYTTVKDAVRAWKQSHREVFLPLSHPPGEAQVDFGEATIKLNGVETKVALFVMTLPYSGAFFRRFTECGDSEGHRRAEFFNGAAADQPTTRQRCDRGAEGRERKLTENSPRCRAITRFRAFLPVRRPTRRDTSSG
jgi:transposase